MHLQPTVGNSSWMLLFAHRLVTPDIILYLHLKRRDGLVVITATSLLVTPGTVFVEQLSNNCQMRESLLHV